MSRSRQKSNVCSWTSHNSGTQKKWRSYENRAKRRKVNMLLCVEKYDALPHDKEYGNEWDSPRDGKCWFHLDKLDVDYYNKLMRK